MVGLAYAADRHVGAYSLGMRQRLGLAAALLGDPPVLVLDEPGNGLDPQGIRWLRDLLRARAAAGGTVFVSSHLLVRGRAPGRRGRGDQPRPAGRPGRPVRRCRRQASRCAPPNRSG